MIFINGLLNILFSSYQFHFSYFISRQHYLVFSISYLVHGKKKPYGKIDTLALHMANITIKLSLRKQLSDSLNRRYYKLFKI
jgi:hypothetical protein